MTTSLSGWMKYLSGPVSGQPDMAAQDFLSRLRTYDPSAHFEADTGSPESPQQGYRIVYNAQALPKSANGKEGAMPIAGSGAREITPNYNGGNIVDKAKIYGDPVYGQWTPSSNTFEQRSANDKWGPAAVAVFTAGAAALAGAGAAGAGAAAAGAGAEGAAPALTLGDMTAGSFGGQFGSGGLIAAEGGAGDALTSGIGAGLGGGGPGGDFMNDTYGGTFNADGTIPDGAPGFDQAGQLGTGGPGDSIGSLASSNNYGGTFNSDGTIPKGAPGFDQAGSSVSAGGPGDSIGALSGAGSGLTLGDIAKGLGGIPGITSLLGGVASGILGKSATDKATDQVLAGIDRARTDATALLGGNQALYKPYMDAGPKGLDALTAMLNQPGLADRYAPIANKSLAGNYGNIANKSLAQNYKPLGAGRGLVQPQITLGQMGRR